MKEKIDTEMRNDVMFSRNGPKFGKMKVKKSKSGSGESPKEASHMLVRQVKVAQVDGGVQ